MKTTSRELLVSRTFQTIPLLCSQSSLSVHARCMSYIARMQIISFDTYKETSPLGFSMKQNLHWTSLGSLILIGLATTLIASPDLVTHSVWIQGPYVGRTRSMLLLLYLQPRQSTKG
jgi:hypothetical protein